jgi:CxxC-x17-CxxC domain-containing protein
LGKYLSELNGIMHLMGNFRDNRGGGDRRSSGGGRSFGGGRSDYNSRGSDRPTMHQAVCSKCGKNCEVPFQPTGSKPVFCRDCFRENGGGEVRRNEGGNFSRPSFERRNDSPARSEAPQSQYKEQFESLNFKLDKILRLLNPEKPIEEAVVVENVEPVEKKKRVKKIFVEDAVEAPVTELPIETEIPLEESPTK